MNENLILIGKGLLYYPLVGRIISKEIDLSKYKNIYFVSSASVICAALLSNYKANEELRKLSKKLLIKNFSYKPMFGKEISAKKLKEGYSSFLAKENASKANYYLVVADENLKAKAIKLSELSSASLAEIAVAGFQNSIFFKDLIKLNNTIYQDALFSFNLEEVLPKKDVKLIAIDVEPNTKPASNISPIIENLLNNYDVDFSYSIKDVEIIEVNKSSFDTDVNEDMSDEMMKKGM